MRMTREEMIEEVKIIGETSQSLADRMSVKGDQDVSAGLTDEDLLKEFESLGCKVQRLVTAMNNPYGHLDTAGATIPTKCLMATTPRS